MIGRRISGVAVVVASLLVLMGACTGDQSLPEPVEVETCDGLVPIGVVYVERMMEALDGLSIEVMTGEADPPEDVAALINLGSELDRRAARLGCDASELNTEIQTETADLEAEDPVTAMFLDIVRGGVVGELPVPPPTTTTTRGE